MPPAGAFNRRGRGFGQAQKTHFAGAHQLGHGAHGVFDGHGFVDAVLVVQINLLDAQTLSAGVATGLHVFGPAIDAARRRVGRVARDAELGRDEHVLSAPCNRLANQQFMGVRPIEVGRIEEVEALVE